MFYFVPNAKVRFRDVWVGAVITGLLWRGGARGILDLRPRYDEIQHDSRADRGGGRILLWVYVSAVILLYRAEMTATYARLRRHRPPEIPAAPSPRT